jgi:hypothetical protein
LIKIDRDSIVEWADKFHKSGDRYFYAYLDVFAPCAGCGQMVSLGDIDFDPGYSVCPHCHGEATFDDFEFESIDGVLREMPPDWKPPLR